MYVVCMMEFCLSLVTLLSLLIHRNGIILLKEKLHSSFFLQSAGTILVRGQCWDWPLYQGDPRTQIQTVSSVSEKFRSSLQTNVKPKKAKTPQEKVMEF